MFNDDVSSDKQSERHCRCGEIDALQQVDEGMGARRFDLSVAFVTFHKHSRWFSHSVRLECIQAGGRCIVVPSHGQCVV